MRLRIGRLLVIATALISNACCAEQEILNSKGPQLLQPYKQQLQAALKSGMSRGIIEAISACQIQAPKIAHDMAKNGVIVGRTSHRLRNPHNTAPQWVTQILERYLNAPTAAVAETVTLSEQTGGYVEPIFMKPLCVTCHGESITDSVARKIQALYPQDQAVGFKVDELRGVFWLEYPLADQ